MARQQLKNWQSRRGSKKNKRLKGTFAPQKLRDWQASFNIMRAKLKKGINWDDDDDRGSGRIIATPFSFCCLLR
jgi:hypothetical protein